MPQKEICQCKYKNFHLNNKTFSIKKGGVLTNASFVLNKYNFFKGIKIAFRTMQSYTILNKTQKNSTYFLKQVL
jgi:hypothetical protein